MKMRTLFWSGVHHGLRRHYRAAVMGSRWWTEVRHRLPSEKVNHLAENLAAAFPERSAAEHRALARQCVAGVQLDELHQYRLELLPRAALVQEVARVKIKGGAHVAQVYAGTRPVIFVTAHYGAYMLAALKIALELPQRRVNFFYNPTARNAYAAKSDALLALVNESCGILHASPKGIVGAVKSLGRGESLCIVVDQLTAEGEIAFVPFFGRFYGAMQGAAFFAQRTGALIMPLFAHTDGTCRTTLEFLPPIDPADNPCGAGEEGLYRTTCAVFRVFEAQMRAAPTHWKYWYSFKRCSLNSPHPPQSSEDARQQLTAVATLLAHDRPLLAERPIWDAAERMFG